MLAAALLALLTGCDEPEPAEAPGDTAGDDWTGELLEDDGVYYGDTLLGLLSWDCDEAGYSFDVEYLGWSASADLWFAQTADSAWTELHAVTPSHVDPNGYDSAYVFSLESVYDQGLGAVVEGSSTFFDCGAHAGAEIFQFDLYDAEDAAVADCGIFGVEPEGDVGRDTAGGYRGAGWDGSCANVY